MATNDYHFITHWRVESTIEEISAILNDPLGLARWWPSVYLDVKVLEPGGEYGEESLKLELARRHATSAEGAYLHSVATSANSLAPKKVSPSATRNPAEEANDSINNSYNHCPRKDSIVACPSTLSYRTCARVRNKAQHNATHNKKNSP